MVSVLSLMHQYTGWMNSILQELGTHDFAQAFGAPLIVLDLMTTVRAGFPSPAEDIGAKRIDLTARLIKHPQATFLMRSRGDSMRDAGIFDGDVLIVDRAIRPRSGHIVIAVVDGEFVCKTYVLRAGRLKLKAANPGHPDIIPKDGQTVEVWGVVTTAIKTLPA